MGLHSCWLGLIRTHSPAPQVGDSTGNFNVVGHMALFQCAGLTV